MKLVFNKAQHTLDEIWLYSSSKGKILGEPYNKPAIGIFYYSYKDIIRTKNDFNEEKYVQKNKDGHFEAVGIYKGYKLLDHVNKRT